MADANDIPAARVKTAPAPPQGGSGSAERPRRAEVVSLPELSPNRAYIWMGIAVLLSAVIMLGAGFYLW